MDTTTAPTAASVRDAYPTTYLLYGQCVAIGKRAGIGERTVRVWLSSEIVPHRKFKGTTARKHYRRDALIAIVFGEEAE